MTATAVGPRGQHQRALPTVSRAAPNVWWLCVGDALTHPDLTGGLAEWMRPSEALLMAVGVPDTQRPTAATEMAAAEMATAGTDVVAKVELDVCGAWVTLANAGPARPVVVRRAGWVDVRGHPALSLSGDEVYEPADDRVGLGPGDAIVLGDGEQSWTDDASGMLDIALGLAGGTPSALAAAVRANKDAHRGWVVAIGVPHDLGSPPERRLVDATGVAAGDLESPGYPLADLQPDLWREPPRPPRVARLRLTSERSGVAAVRTLLDRLLASWRLDGRVDDDDVKLVATELAANAVVHSSRPDTVTVRYLGDVIRVEVIDRSSDLPQPEDPSDDGLGGRGLRIVEALGSAWGSEPLVDGKRVWCELAVNAPG